jgi:hypothetical protein
MCHCLEMGVSGEGHSLKKSSIINQRDAQSSLSSHKSQKSQPSTLTSNTPHTHSGPRMSHSGSEEISPNYAPLFFTRCEVFLNIFSVYTLFSMGILTCSLITLLLFMRKQFRRRDWEWLFSDTQDFGHSTVVI